MAKEAKSSRRARTVAGKSRQHPPAQGKFQEESKTMPQATRMIEKLTTAAGQATLEVSVSKQGGPVNTGLEVASSGPDDSIFLDNQLTPGPAARPIDPVNNSYVLGWTGAFVSAGSATLNVRVSDSDSDLQITRTMTVNGQAGDVFARVLFVP